MVSTEVDTGAAGIGGFVHYLDTVSTVRFFQEYKRRSFEALELASTDRVLDAGCGVGTDVFAIAGLPGHDATVCGVDLDGDLVAEAAARAAADGVAGVEFHTADVTALPFADASFGACRADRVLVHVADAQGALEELWRVCRPGGAVLVSEPDYATLVIDAAPAEGTRAAIAAYVDGFTNPFVAHRLPALFRRAGFVDVTVTADTFIVSDHALAELVFELPLIAARAVAGGVFTTAEGEAWLSALRAGGSIAGDEPMFFAAITGFGVRGRRPGPGRRP